MIGVYRPDGRQRQQLDLPRHQVHRHPGHRHDSTGAPKYVVIQPALVEGTDHHPRRSPVELDPGRRAARLPGEVTGPSSDRRPETARSDSARQMQWGTAPHRTGPSPEAATRPESAASTRQPGKLNLLGRLPPSLGDPPGTGDSRPVRDRRGDGVRPAVGQPPPPAIAPRRLVQQAGSGMKVLLTSSPKRIRDLMEMLAGLSGTARGIAIRRVSRAQTRRRQFRSKATQQHQGCSSSRLVNGGNRRAGGAQGASPRGMCTLPTSSTLPPFGERIGGGLIAAQIQGVTGPQPGRQDTSRKARDCMPCRRRSRQCRPITSC